MITERIFHWAKHTPYSAALIHNGERWSYRSFARRIAKARSYFARRGFSGPGHAALAVGNMGDFWVLSLALRSLGLTTLAVRSAAAVRQLGLPDMRLVATVAAEAWPGLQEACAARGLPLLSVVLDGETGLPLEVTSSHPPGGHIVWTSGTTGADKMVLLGPGNDAYFLPLKVEIAGLSKDSVLCMFGMSGASAASCRWSASAWIAGGATLVEQGGERYRALTRPGITHAFVNPAMLARILAAPGDAFGRNDAMKLFVGGGAMTRTQVAAARARITPHLFNFLASTEAGPIAVTPLEVGEDHRWHRLLPDRRVELVDEQDRPVPAGEMGQVRIATAGGPTRYVQDEAATRSFFRGGFFYPGDLAVLRSDGRMALHGRLTDVINVQGKKVSPTRIEDRLVEMFEAASACLFSQQNEAGEEELRVVIETASPFEAERMGAVLKELGGFSQAIVHFIPQMPRNAMGKVMRREVRVQSRTMPGHPIRW